ncbi:hypothetical protein BA895_21050 [Humibacillus sp. DSM 29435]|uniref:YciI family protein n=1 Tax=Humibacillus sp. DSM 29435 TaxID=1869167 RepID=UPI00087271A1|nr:YciI family protein [Humibacillus sp. DSM 29435]OFE15994.1 hypothetical protein BA895_21050 [Humibacillus sp. DSM 29435]
MAEYLLYFNQQWVGEHTEEWFRGRGPLARAVTDEMKAAGPYETKEFLGGFAVVDVADDEAATMWAGKIAQACGWPHEVRRFKPQLPPPVD